MYKDKHLSIFPRQMEAFVYKSNTRSWHLLVWNRNELQSWRFER